MSLYFGDRNAKTPNIEDVLYSDNKNAQPYFSVTIIDGKPYRILVYIRYAGKDTELWFFGSGLGDAAIICQMGDAFLNYLTENPDPCLGRISIACGIGSSAYVPWKGNFNLYYAWGGIMSEDWLPEYLNKAAVPPQLILCPSKVMVDYVEDKGADGLLLPVGVGRFFKPLGLNRVGFGYVGGDSKSREQVDAVLGPFLKHKDFKWPSSLVSLTELNRWYNQRQICFGMRLPANERWQIVSNRVFETLASGTPLIQFKYSGINETLGFDYPYVTASKQETCELADKILEDYPATLSEFEGYSERVRREHNYVNRLKVLFKRLEELR